MALSTREKLLFGLSLLVGLVLVAFQFIKSMKSQQSPSNQARPQRNNNPFALLQLNPSNWVGLAGKDADGLLKFDSPLNGVRAGFINLYKRYLKQGLNTITKIAPVYTGLKDWQGYAQGLSKVSGIGINELITQGNIKRLGRGIERMEAGYQWVSDNDFDNGFYLATEYSSGGGSGGGGGYSSGGGSGGGGGGGF